MPNPSHRRERQPESETQSKQRADRESQDGFDQRDGEVEVDRAAGEPHPDFPEHDERLAEEELGAIRVIEIKRRDQPRLSHHVPEQQYSAEQ
jgi:hypothetical protein